MTDISKSYYGFKTDARYKLVRKFSTILKMGAIIGRGGSRITEIRHRSTQEIKIHEQEENSQNRRITVSGSKELIGRFLSRVTNNL